VCVEEGMSGAQQRQMQIYAASDAGKGVVSGCSKLDAAGFLAREIGKASQYQTGQCHGEENGERKQFFQRLAFSG
jgi:hypothetical protein